MYNKLCAVFHSIAEIKGMTDARRTYVNALTRYDVNPSVVIAELVKLSSKFDEILVGVDGVLTRNRATALGKIMLITIITDINKQIDTTFEEIQSILDNTTSFLSASMVSFNQQIDHEILGSRKAAYEGKQLASLYMAKTINSIILNSIEPDSPVTNPSVYLLNLQNYLADVDKLKNDELTKLSSTYSNFVTNINALASDVDTLVLEDGTMTYAETALKASIASVKDVAGGIDGLTRSDLFKFLLTLRHSDSEVNTIDVLNNIIDVLPHINNSLTNYVETYDTYIKSNNSFCEITKMVNNILTERVKADNMDNLNTILNLADLAAVGNYKLLDGMVDYGILLNSKLNICFTTVNFIDEITQKGVIK